jgi:hypothetical protein
VHIYRPRWIRANESAKREKGDAASEREFQRQVAPLLKKFGIEEWEAERVC